MDRLTEASPAEMQALLQPVGGHVLQIISECLNAEMNSHHKARKTHP